MSVEQSLSGQFAVCMEMETAVGSADKVCQVAMGMQTAGGSVDKVYQVAYLTIQ